MNKKIKTILLTAFSICFLVESAWADEIWNFTRITCIPELNYFEASNVEINSGSNEENNFMNENQEQIRKKYNLRGETLTDIQECKLKDANLKIQVKYRTGANPDSTLKLWIDDKLMVDLDGFGYYASGGAKSISSIGFKIFKNSNLESVLYFKEKDPAQIEYPCVIWLDKKKQNIESNGCNDSYKNKSLPVKNDHIAKYN